MGNRRLIIVPYAYGGNTGVSIQNRGKQLTTYMKNNCTACLSTKVNVEDDVDVMLISNIEIPEPYASLLSSKGILLQICPFDKFNFGSANKVGEKIQWQLAFYKLCALSFCVRNLDYDCYCFMDSDVFVQGAFEKIWKDAEQNIMLYDINEPTDGYMVKEMQEFLHTNSYLTHFGGEFFAANKQLTEQFITGCERVYREMIDANYMTKSGDEFITSIVASRMKLKVKNAGAYIRRYWTGSYRLMCNDYEKNNIVILHMPAEKEQGIIKLYDKYISKGTVPKKQTVWKIGNFKHPSLRVRIGLFLRLLGILK
ncbi:hypothetical protein [Bacteroides acidifaciens]|uniref:hypothetical protein n=1 Tax=Bacteroides acidifaciens TaxID=85831 RepID=UPI00301545DB